MSGADELVVLREVDGVRWGEDFPDDFTGIYEDAQGSREWIVDGRWHRDGAPACEWADGTWTWYQHGKKHRADGPANLTSTTGAYEWWLNGRAYWVHHGQIDQSQQAVDTMHGQAVRIDPISYHGRQIDVYFDAALAIEGFAVELGHGQHGPPARDIVLEHVARQLRAHRVVHVDERTQQLWQPPPPPEPLTPRRGRRLRA